jgi:hypothetical protein
MNQTNNTNNMSINKFNPIYTTYDSFILAAKTVGTPTRLRGGEMSKAYRAKVRRSAKVGIYLPTYKQVFIKTLGVFRESNTVFDKRVKTENKIKKSISTKIEKSRRKPP